MPGFGYFSKPLHLPKPRRRDRRAGARSERRDAVLRQPTEGGGWRPPADKRRALRRLLDRNAGDRAHPVLATLVAVAGVLLVGFGAFQMVASGRIVAYEEAPDAYAALVEAVDVACQRRTCTFGTRNRGANPPPKLRRAMDRLHVETVAYDPWLARYLFLGSPGRPAALAYDRPLEGLSPSAAAAIVDRRIKYGRRLTSRAPDGSGGWTGYVRR